MPDWTASAPSLTNISVQSVDWPGSPWQRDANFGPESHIAETESAGGALATPVSRALLCLVAIGSDCHPLCRRPRNESLDTARVDRRDDVDFLCFNLSTKRAGTGRGVLNPFK